MKMSYYLFNRQELLQKLKDRYYNGGGKKNGNMVDGRVIS